MSRSLRINHHHIQSVKSAVQRQGYPSQQALAEALGFARSTVNNFLNGKPVDYAIFVELSQALNLDWQAIADLGECSTPTLEPSLVSLREDWADAIDVSMFCGRTQELTTLAQWICGDSSPARSVGQRCRLVALLGMGGIGKTSLAITFAQQVSKLRSQESSELSNFEPPDADPFEYIIWRSLRNAPPLSDLLADLIEVLSERQETTGQLPKDVPGRLSRLLHYLRNQRCLLILDNVETILRSGGRAGDYRPGYEGYGELLRQVGMVPHQSCLILTSREKPSDVAVLEGDLLPVRSLQLAGLPLPEVQTILTSKGLHGPEAEIEQLANCYSGNPLALKIVATSIKDLFGGSIATFLGHSTTIFNGIRLLLDQQFMRLSHLEQQVMYWLSINREPVSLAELQADLAPTVFSAILIESLESLGRRCLIETVSPSDPSRLMEFTQQPVVMEYVSDRLIEQICQELKAMGRSQSETVNQAYRDPSQPHSSGSAALFHTHALIKATAKDYIRTNQIRVILAEVANRLQLMVGDRSVIEHHLQQVLAVLRQNYSNVPGYSAGNWINLCTYFKLDLAHANLSELTIWQADLRQVPLHHTNFAHADLAKSLFAEVLSNTLSVAFSADGQHLASGDGDGGIRLWQVLGGASAPASISKLLLTLQGHAGWVHSVCFSLNSDNTSSKPIVASGGADCTVRLWDPYTGKCLQILRGHTSAVWCVSFSPDGRWLASSGDDNTVRLWDPIRGECLDILEGHTNQVYAIGFSPDGQLLASGSADQTVRLWEVPPEDAIAATLSEGTGKQYSVQCLRVWQVQGPVSSVRFDAAGEYVASGSLDHTVQLWDVRSGKCWTTLQGHTDQIWCVHFSPDGKLVASGSHDQTIRLWNVQSGRCLRVLHGHTDRVWSVDFSSDGHTLVSGSMDQTVRLWDTSTGQCLQVLRGHTNPIYVVSFSPEGVLASGSEDGMVRLWNHLSGTCCQTLAGHTAGIWALHSSPDSRWLASGANDHTVRLWNLQEPQCLRTLQGHDGWVLAVRWSPDSQWLATGSADHTAKLWEIETGECHTTLSGHTSWVFAVDISPNGLQLATGSADQTVRLWDIQTGQCLATLAGHDGWIRTVSFSPDGDLLASGSTDHTIRLWDVDTGTCIRVLEGHTNWIWSVCFSPVCTQQSGETGQPPLLLASSGDDSTIRLWDSQTGDCLQVLQGHTHRIWSLAFSSDGRSLASSSSDETIALWDVKTGDRLKVFKPEKLYEGMNITRVSGITAAQKATLKALGAVEH